MFFSLHVFCFHEFYFFPLLIVLCDKELFLHVSVRIAGFSVGDAELLIPLLVTGPLHRHPAGFLCSISNVVCIHSSLDTADLSASAWPLNQFGKNKTKKPPDSCLTWLIAFCMSHLGLWCCAGRDLGFLGKLKSSKISYLFCIVSFAS